MSNSTCCQCDWKKGLLVLGLVVAVLLGGAVVRQMIRTVPSESPRSARAHEREKNRQDYQEALAKETAGVGVVNAEAGIYRIPVEQAMELTLKEWQNPEAARKQLIERVEKAFPAPPVVPASEQPKSQFE